MVTNFEHIGKKNENSSAVPHYMPYTTTRTHTHKFFFARHQKNKAIERTGEMKIQMDKRVWRNDQAAAAQWLW